MEHLSFFLGSQSGADGIGFKTRSDDRHLNGLAQGRIFANAHDDVGLPAGFCLNEIVDFANLVEGDFVLVGAGDNQQQDVFGAPNVVVVEEGAVQGAGNGFGGAVGAACGKGAHEGGSAAGKNGLGVAEVNVGAVVVGDDFGNAAGGGGQHFVRLVEAGFEAEVPVNFAQLVVVHHNEGIHVGAQFLDARFCLARAHVSFKSKRQGDDAHGEDAHFLGGFGDDGGGSGSGATAHSGGDEHHLGVGGQEGFDVVCAFQCGAFPDFGVGAGAQTFG